MLGTKSIPHYYKGGYILPPGYSWNPRLVNNKKEGSVEVFDEDGMISASLEYKNDLLNGVCQFYSNGMVSREIPYCDDVADGWGCEYDDNGRKKMCLFEKGEKKLELKKSEKQEGYYDEIDVNSGEIISTCMLDENHKKRGKGFTFKNGMIHKVVMYENGDEKYCEKEFCEKIMIEYDENGKKVYEGDYLNSIEKEFPREGHGKEYCNEMMIYKGEWKENKRNGRGMSLRNKRAYYSGMWKDNLPEGEGKMFGNGKMLCTGNRWDRGRLRFENGKWIDYEREVKEGDLEERVYTFGWTGRIKLRIKGKDMVYEDSSNKIHISGTIDREEIAVTKWNAESGHYEPCKEPVVYDQTVNLGKEGNRWEGTCLDGNPIGNGKIFNRRNQIVYKGFIYDGKKVCYGEEYYADSGTVEYRGWFANDLRHGWGCLYDKEGRVIYEGNWSFGKNDNLVMRIPDKCEDDEMISNVLKELIIGKECYQNMKEFLFCDFNELERLEIGDSSFRNTKKLSIQNCSKLNEIVFGYENDEYGCCSDVESFELASLI